METYEVTAEVIFLYRRVLDAESAEDAMIEAARQLHALNTGGDYVDARVLIQGVREVITPEDF